MVRENSLVPQIEVSASEVKKRIYSIRGRQVMLDRDLAEIYGVETKYLKRAVRSNIRRFPLDFMFELNRNETKNLRCKFCTLESENCSEADDTGLSLRCKCCTLPIFRYVPFAFTEYGIGMLSSVLNSEKAISINILIIRAFTELQREQATKLNTSHSLESLETMIKQRFDQLEARLQNQTLQTPRPAKHDTVVAIQNTIAEHFGLIAADLKSASRMQPISLARQIAIFFMKKYLGMGFSEIGRQLGGRDHSTILHAYRKIHVDSEDSEMVRKAVMTLSNELRPLFA